MNKKWVSLFLSVLVCTGCSAAPPASSDDAPAFDVTAPFSQSEGAGSAGPLRRGYGLAAGTRKNHGKINAGYRYCGHFG